jgi:hypothetical protein
LDSEAVVFAVFQSTSRDGNRVSPKAFENKQLVRGEVSLARPRHMTRAEFDHFVVRPLASSRGELVGVVRAEVSILRDLPYGPVQGTDPPVTGRAICVLDKVSNRDFEAHAALQYSESQQSRLTDTQRSKIRPVIRENLAIVFGEMIAPESAFTTK